MGGRRCSTWAPVGGLAEPGCWMRGLRSSVRGFAGGLWKSCGCSGCACLAQRCFYAAAGEKLQILLGGVGETLDPAAAFLWKDVKGESLEFSPA